MNKGVASTLVTLSIVVIGIVASLAASSLLKKRSSIVSNPRAATCGPPINLSTLKTACCFSQTNSTCNKYERVYAHLSARIANQMTTPCTTACYGTAYNATGWYECPDSTIDHCADPTKTPTPTRTPTPKATVTRAPTPQITSPPGASPTRTPTPVTVGCWDNNTRIPPKSCCSNGNTCDKDAIGNYGCVVPGCTVRTPTPTQPPPPGASPTPPRTPTSTLKPTATIPPAQACKLVGSDTYRIGQFTCDEPSNIVSKCSGYDNWQQVIPNPCGASRCTNDPGGHSYSCVAKCEAVGSTGSNKLKIAFLPENYSSAVEFRTVVSKAISQIRKTNLGSLVDKMNFYIVNDYNQTYHDNPAIHYDGIQFGKIFTTGASVCGANSSIVIDRPPCEGGDYGGRAIMGLSSYVCGVSDEQEVPHELGHAIALLYDEYGNANSPPAFPDIDRANCSTQTSGNSSAPCPKWSSFSGVGCYEGCGGGFSKWYRPDPLSIMRGREEYPKISRNFNPPSLKAWQDLLKKYQ